MGDQPLDIEDKLIELIMPYISNPNSLILTILKANDNISNSNTLKMAYSVDPEAKRTIAVFLKIKKFKLF